MTLLGLELAWTRIFSAEFFYTYAFLVLSLAVMGLGLGALALRLCPALGGRRSLGIVLTLVGCAALAGPPLVFHLGLNFSQLAESWGMVGAFGGGDWVAEHAVLFGRSCAGGRVPGQPR